MPSRTSLLLTLIWLSGLAAGRGLEAQDVSPAMVSLVSATNVSDRFRRETEAATRSVPSQVWKTLDEGGWRVQLAEFVVDAAPSLRGVRPPGWPLHLTWDNSDAIHLPTARLLVLAEKRRNRAGEIVASSRVAGVLRHEIGHAFDMAAGRGTASLSASPDFMWAYQQDRTRISAEDRGTFAYYLQDGRSGLQEAFAEAFAVVLGGGSSDIAASEFETHFPRVMAYTRDMITEPIAFGLVNSPSRAPSTNNVRRRFFVRR